MSMSNGEICRWAWEKCKGNRGTLLGAWMISFVPVLLGGVVEYAERQGVIQPFRWWSLPVSILATALRLGYDFVVLSLVMPRPLAVGVEDVFAPFRKEWRKKALLLALILAVMGAIVSIYPNRVMEQGQTMMEAMEAVDDLSTDQERIGQMLFQAREGQKIYQRGQRLGAFLSGVLGFLFFPVPYLLFLRPERSFGELWKEGIKTTFHNWTTLLGMGLRIGLVFLAAVMLEMFLLRNWIFLPAFFITIGLWAPWGTLALAKLAAEIIEDGSVDPWWARTNTNDNGERGYYHGI